ncbi:MAG: hypothetical protein JWO36_202 [Myxococcales bacterium]|nr:hypothetical protein [Myxococcales bacterium]
MIVLLGACGRLDFATTQSLDAAPETYPLAVLADHPVVYLRLDDTGGMVASDATGLGRDGRYSVQGGTLVYGLAGALGGTDHAVSMTGDGNSGPNLVARVALPTSVYPWAGDFTIEFFVRPDAPPPIGWKNALFLWEDFRLSGFRTGWTINYLPELWTDEAGGTATITSTTPLVAGAWNHIAYTKHGNNVSIYLGGTLVAEGAIDYNVPPPDADNCLGSCHGMPSSGAFDELAIYGSALTAQQIQVHVAAAGI